MTLFNLIITEHKIKEAYLVNRKFVYEIILDWGNVVNVLCTLFKVIFIMCTYMYVQFVVVTLCTYIYT